MKFSTHTVTPNGWPAATAVGTEWKASLAATAGVTVTVADAVAGVARSPVSLSVAAVVYVPEVAVVEMAIPTVTVTSVDRVAEVQVSVRVELDRAQCQPDGEGVDVKVSPEGTVATNLGSW